MFMFFKRKKNKKSDDSNSVRCESPDCPTPDLVHSKNECYKLDDLILCQFCYTKQLAEKPVTVDYDNTKTKKIDRVEMNRIATQKSEWDLSNSSTSNLSRIGPSSVNEKYLEEINIWTNILKELHIEANIEKITKFSHSSKMRILQSTSEYLFVSFLSEDEKNIKSDEDKLSKIILNLQERKSITFNRTEISTRNLDWLVENKVISTTKDLDSSQVQIIRITQEQIFLLEELPEKTDLINNESFIYELGQYFYFLNFIGCSVPFQIIIIQKDDICTFMHTNTKFAQSAFYDLKATLRDLYLTIPFILDEDKLETFLDGSEKAKQTIITLLDSESKAKNDILGFFTNHKIAFDSAKELPSLRDYL